MRPKKTRYDFRVSVPLRVVIRGTEDRPVPRLRDAQALVRDFLEDFGGSLSRFGGEYSGSVEALTRGRRLTRRHR